MGVSAAGSAAAIRGGAKTFALPRSIALTSIPPTLITRDTTVTAAGPARRTKIWEFNINLHCSIVGTCLSAGELRQILKKLFEKRTGRRPLVLPLVMEL